jgi:hypothetical protein
VRHISSVITVTVLLSGCGSTPEQPSATAPVATTAARADAGTTEPIPTSTEPVEATLSERISNPIAASDWWELSCAAAAEQIIAYEEQDTGTSVTTSTFESGFFDESLPADDNDLAAAILAAQAHRDIGRAVHSALSAVGYPEVSGGAEATASLLNSIEQATQAWSALVDRLLEMPDSATWSSQRSVVNDELRRGDYGVTSEQELFAVFPDQVVGEHYSSVAMQQLMAAYRAAPSCPQG